MRFQRRGRLALPLFAQDGCCAIRSRLLVSVEAADVASQWYARLLDSDELATMGKYDAEGCCCMREGAVPVRCLLHGHCIRVSVVVEVEDVR